MSETRPDFYTWKPQPIPRDDYTVDIEIAPQATQIVATCTVRELQEIAWSDDGDVRPIHVPIISVHSSGQTIEEAQFLAFKTASYFMHYGVITPTRMPLTERWDDVEDEDEEGIYVGPAEMMRH